MSRLPIPASFLRKLFVCALLASFVPVAAVADPDPNVTATGARVLSHDDDSDKTTPAPVKNAGSIDGQVVSVDYKMSHISVKAAGTQYDIVVSPSTEFRGHNDNFHTIADLQKGAHVQVLMSQRAGTYTAQIIRLF